MPKFEPAENRVLEKQICMRCNARNSVEATRCRKCGYGNLRRKSKERRNA
jgi:large subunit ribosomal protein L40e